MAAAPAIPFQSIARVQIALPAGPAGDGPAAFGRAPGLVRISAADPSFAKVSLTNVASDAQREAALFVSDQTQASSSETSKLGTSIWFKKQSRRIL